MRDRKTVAFTRLYGFCAAEFSKTATNFVLRPWQTARRKAVMSFPTRLGNGHRELLFDRSRCFNFRRTPLKFSRQTKSPGPTSGAFVSLKQLAYLEMKSQSSSEDMEIQLSIDGGMRLKRSAPGARDKDIGRRTFVPKIHVEISKVQHPMLA
jgi:hypothetical protein